MGTVYAFAQCEGIIPLGLQHNPLHWVKGFSSISDYEAMTLEPEQTYWVLELLEQPEYTLLLLIAATGLRMSEALGLRWMDVLWDKGQIRIRWIYVHNGDAGRREDSVFEGCGGDAFSVGCGADVVAAGNALQQA